MNDFSAFLPPLLGGALIGGAAGLLVLTSGRVAGISGIVGGVLESPRAHFIGREAWRLAFLVGLLASPWLVSLVRGDAPGAAPTGGAVVTVTGAHAATLALAGLLVGFGTRLGSGCTSGHGVCGLARRSGRSLAAVATFMVTGALTVAVTRGLP